MIVLTGKQIKDLLDFACPDEGDEDQLKSDIAIEFYEAGEHDESTKEPFRQGYYAFLVEYPEEGSIFLEP